jgi:MFS family permease
VLAGRDTMLLPGPLSKIMPRLSRAVWVLLAGQFVSVAGSGATLPYLFVYLNQARGLQPVLVGDLLTVRAVGALAGALAGGALVDAAGPKRATLWLTGASALSTCGIALIREPLLGALILGLYGVVLAAEVTALDALLGAVAQPRERSPAFDASYLLHNVGGAGGAAIAACALALWPMTTALPVLYVLDAVTFVIMAAIIARWVPRPAEPTQSSVKAGGNYRALAADPAFRWLSIIVLLLVGAGFCQLHVGLPAFVTAKGLSAAGLGWVFAANMVTVIGLQVPLRRLFARLRRTTHLSIGLAVIAAAWALAQLGWEAGLPMLVAVGVLFACGEIFLSPILSSLVNDMAPPELRGRYNGAHTLCWTSGWLGGTAITAVVLGTGHSDVLFFVFVVLLALAALAVIRLNRHLPAALNAPRTAADHV